jgi:hypothetical protein
VITMICGWNQARAVMAVSGAALAAAACALHDVANAQPECEVGIVVGLTASSADAVSDTGRATGARIERGAAISSDAAAFTVRAPGAETACLAVIERLRNDARVRFVELDERRNARQAVGP